MSAAPKPVITPPIPFRRRSVWPRVVGASVGLAALAVAGWLGVREYRKLTAPAGPSVPTARVKRGDVSFDVYAQGSLKGGGAEMLVAPPVTGLLNIRDMDEAGAAIKPGDVVVQLDTSTQQYNLVQAQEALDQAKTQVVQAQNNANAQTEDDSYQLAKAQWDVQRAELQVKRNPTLAAVDAQKNDLALKTAQEHVAQLKSDVTGREASNKASVATQTAAVGKAAADAATAQNSIDSMTLRAHHAGYLSPESNMAQGIIYYGMQLPPFQTGDSVRSGMAIAEIPDTSAWEVTVAVSELDAGHLTVGEPAGVEFVALPGQSFAGRLKSVGAVQGPAWNRQVNCVLSLDRPSTDLRPGFSSNVVINAETLRNVLWAPSQAVFDSGGHSYVYREVNGQFARQEVKVARRSESQVVITGLAAGDVIALSNPEQAAASKAKAKSSASALGGVGK